MNTTDKKCTKPLSFLSCTWQKIRNFVTGSNSTYPSINHDIEAKQKIEADSPEKNAQRNFIEEGGDSQSLKK